MTAIDSGKQGYESSREEDEHERGGNGRERQQHPDVIHSTGEDLREPQQRNQREGVGEDPDAEQLAERKGEHDRRGRRCGGERRERPRSPRRAAVEPEHERDEEQRKDAEHVPLLDAQREAGREEGSLRGDPCDRGDSRGQKGALGLAGSAAEKRETEKNDQRGHREHAGRQ